MGTQFAWRRSATAVAAVTGHTTLAGSYAHTPDGSPPPLRSMQACQMPLAAFETCTGRQGAQQQGRSGSALEHGAQRERLGLEHGLLRLPRLGRHAAQVALRVVVRLHLGRALARCARQRLNRPPRNSCSGGHIPIAHRPGRALARHARQRLNRPHRLRSIPICKAATKVLCT